MHVKSDHCITETYSRYLINVHLPGSEVHHVYVGQESLQFVFLRQILGQDGLENQFVKYRIFVVQQQNMRLLV